ncbi:MAG TPA: Holliday junction branch migration protein RuvA [Candidatus Cloacimonadota bacterium]|nr:Holliday junction branch migration protein RuvA [Candidatus Cloacimonadota bacterium]
MIHYITGTLVAKSPVTAVIESFGIAWELNIALSTYEKLPLLGEKTLLYSLLQFSQDQVRLYGFGSLAEKELFQKLISVSGIGPKIAISVISTLSLSSFVRSIRNGEEHILTKVPGLGKKSAQRLIVELKDKVADLADNLDEVDKRTMDKDSMEVESALIALGFNPKDIRRELSLLKAEEKDLTIEQTIKETIKRLYQRSK